MDEITLQLPSGETMKVERDDTRALAQRLWNIALHPSAAPIAVKLSDAVSTSAFLRRPIEVSEREYGALRQVLAHQATH